MALLWSVLPTSRLVAQATFDTLVVGDTIYINNCRYSNGEIRIDSLPINIIMGNNSSSDYPNNGVYDAWAVLDLNEVTNILIYHFNVAAHPDNRIEVYDTRSPGSPIVNTHTTASGVDTVEGGTYVIHLHLRHSSAHQGAPVFSFRWAGASTSSTCRHSLRSVTVTNVAGNSAMVNWVSNTDSIYIDYGGGSRLVIGDSYLIMGLDAMTTYHLRVNTWGDAGNECCFIDRTFTTNTSIPPVCIDVTDLESPFNTCTYGSAQYPGDSIGRIDGRHTIMTNPSEYDPLVGSALPTVPPGHATSLRLGNAKIGAKGENVICQMMVDTTQYDILLIKYAAVLQQPGHAPNAQPRFRFTILDQNMQPVDPTCGAADFIASDDLGWNTFNVATGPVAWKNWTTVGIDLTPYHGQYINIRFTTMDCAGGEHFGYAYIATECYRKGITSPHCGSTAISILTAPPGFNYYWYTDLSPDTVSTAPTVSIVESNTYYNCRLIYVEDTSCWFEMRVWAGHRYPLAAFDYEISTTDCRQFNVIFNNRSTISNDGVTPVASGEPCEQAWWNFGNGQTSTEYSPTVHYDTTGTYYVTLVSSIGGGECKDTLTVPITMPTYITYQEYMRACDSLTWWRNGNTYYHDTIGVLDIHPSPDNCDTAYDLHLIVDHSKFTTLDRDTACWRTPYSWQGHTFDDTISTVTLYHLGDTLRTVHGCDSIIGIEVIRYPRVPITLEANADCHIKQYRLVGRADAPFLRWQATPPDPNLEGHYADSVLTLSPEQTTTYTLVADFGVAEVCPSSKSITLEPVSFPTALLRLSPEYLTLDNMEFEAHDIGQYNQPRSWTVSQYTSGQATPLPTPPPDQHIHSHCTTTDIDSVVVSLTVGTGTCTDTAIGSIPMKRATIWAPNIFTPDNATNNRFQIYTTGLHATELNIYNRDGLLMFHATDLEEQWDGTHNGRPCTQGAYVWCLSYIADDFPDKAQKKVGTVLLLR